MEDCTPLAFAFLFGLGAAYEKVLPPPVGWVFPLQLSLPGKSLTDIPQSVFLRDL